MQYKAFMSYSHAADGKLAPALQSALQRFAKPWYQLRAFRDDAELVMNEDLWGGLKQALNESEYFILMASRRAGSSRWVQREVEHWFKVKKNESTRKLIIVQTDGNLVWNENTNDFVWDENTPLPLNLKETFKHQPRYIDLRWAQDPKVHLSLDHNEFRDAVAAVGATLHNRPKQDLIGEEVRQHRKTKTLTLSVVMALFIFSIAAILGAYFATQQANRARANAIVTVASSLLSNGKPSLGALVIAELEGQPEASGGSNVARRSAATPISRSVLQGHTGGVSHAAFSPDGQYVVTVGDTTPRVWRADGTGEPILLQGHTRYVNHAAFSPDGQYVVTAGDSAQVWRADGTGEPILLQGHTQEVNHAAFSPDGQYVVTAADDRTARVWRVGWTALMDHLKDATTACLTSEQRIRFLAESSSDASQAFIKCERGYGRNPGS